MKTPFLTEAMNSFQSTAMILATICIVYFYISAPIAMIFALSIV